MKDRFLFKAKRVDNGEWAFGHYVNSGFIIKMNHLECVDIDENTVCQCTGLKDDNGNLIWENDVVRVYGDTDDSGNDLYYFYKVVWNKDLCCWWLSDIYTQEDEYLYICLKEIDIIGNIFDNPELLESE